MPRGLIQTPDTQTRLSKRFGIRERVTAPTLAPELQPVVIVDDVFNVPDYASTTRRACIGRKSVAANVGQVGSVWLRNPLGSGVLAIVKRMWCSTQANGQEMIGILDSTGLPGAAAQTTRFINVRIAGLPQVRMEENNLGPTPAGGSPVFGFLSSAAGAVTQDLTGWVLPPDHHISMHSVQTNLGVLVTWEWDEVTIEA